MRSKKTISHKFLKDGFYDFGSILNKKKCLELKKFIDINRPCTKNIFYKNKKEFIKKKGSLKIIPQAHLITMQFII